MIPLSLDLEAISDLIDDNLAGIEMYLAAQALLLAVMIGVALYRRAHRSPVDRLVRRRHFGV